MAQFDRKAKNAVKNANTIRIDERGIHGITSLVTEVKCPDGFKRNVSGDLIAPFLDAAAGKNATARVNVESREVYTGVHLYEMVGTVQTVTMPKEGSKKTTPTIRTRHFLIDSWCHADEDTKAVLAQLAIDREAAQAVQA